jgi:hypothetical protein
VEEKWLTIDGFPDYSVSNLGRVRRDFSGRRLDAGEILSQSPNKHGYLRVELWKDGDRKCRRVNSLVCTAFNGQPPSADHIAAHWDGVPSNNVASNLRWATQLENAADRYRHGTDAVGEQNPNAKLTLNQVVEIKGAAPYIGVVRDLAKKYKVHQSTISDIRSGKLWPKVSA